jgi:hypothetical protein
MCGRSLSAEPKRHATSPMRQNSAGAGFAIQPVDPQRVDIDGLRPGVGDLLSDSRRQHDAVSGESASVEPCWTAGRRPEEGQVVGREVLGSGPRAAAVHRQIDDPWHSLASSGHHVLEPAPVQSYLVARWLMLAAVAHDQSVAVGSDEKPLVTSMVMGKSARCPRAVANNIRRECVTRTLTAAGRLLLLMCVSPGS